MNRQDKRLDELWLAASVARSNMRQEFIRSMLKDPTEYDKLKEELEFNRIKVMHESTFRNLESGMTNKP